MPEPLTCSECQMCCRLMAVDDLAPPKPAGTWCTHVRLGKGCGVYDTRPASCRSFECLWLRSQARPEPERLPIELRPDRCKVVMVAHGNDLVLKVDPGRPDAPRRDPLASLLKTMMRAGFRVFVGIADNKYMLKEIKQK